MSAKKSKVTNVKKKTRRQRAPCRLPSRRTRRLLKDMHGRFNTPGEAADVWQNVLSIEERARLAANYAEAWNRFGGTVRFVAAAWQCSRVEALIRLCDRYGSYDQPTRDSFWREWGLNRPAEAAQLKIKPHWDGHNTLTLGVRLLRRVRNREVASNLAVILDAFQAKRWPTCIADPLQGDDDQRRLETVRNLNRKLVGIRFFSGSKKTICWEFH